MEIVVDRQKEILQGKSKRSPLIIFPEGSTSNNTHIIKFKRGAFESLFPVIPLTIKYHCPVVHVGNQVMPDHVVSILLACCLRPVIVEAKIFPVFMPNEYLF